MDYNKAICDKIEAYLTEKGFNQRFAIKQIEGTYDPSKSTGTAFIQVRNILDGYSFPDNSVSAIDMTVAVHHATQYESDILDIFKEAYRVLTPGGLLHVGEGNVDMKHSERKLKKLGNDLLASGEEGVCVIDTRYQDLPARETCFGAENHKNATVIITDKGMVKISNTKDSSKALNHLQSAGYKQLYQNNGDIILPFIDHAMEEDFHGMIIPVRNYYSAVKQTCLEKLAKDKHEAFLKAITKEQNDAERGLVEFYSHPAMVLDNLQKAGFGIVEKRYTEHGPFINILAKKY
jgi:SAM-dependent methyltransferase